MVDMEGSSVINTSKEDKDDDEEEVAVLPGFRFHPTDEELVGFYLKRKVDKRPISIELIKHIDIYKFDPWDLPKGSNVGDKEWYFFCKRGRKYRNSIRPNRVTGSGFWKATGIDRPIYSGGGGSRDSNCIGLKKSLVYYRGSAGKGTKTDWMMHEFRLPSQHDTTANTPKHQNHINDPKTIAQEAEVWTLCRIFKRNVSYRKCIPEWKELTGGARAGNNNYKQQQRSAPLQMNHEVVDHMDESSKTCSLEFDHPNNYISFTTTTAAAAANMNPTISVMNNSNKKPYMNIHHHGVHLDSRPNHNQQLSSSSSSVSHPQVLPLTTNNVMNMNHGSSLGSAEFSELLKQGEWDELRSMFESAAAAPLFHL